MSETAKSAAVSRRQLVGSARQAAPSAMLLLEEICRSNRGRGYPQDFCFQEAERLVNS